MAGIFAPVRRLTFWLAGTPDDSPPPVPIPPQFAPLLDHVAFFLNLRGRLPPEMTREEIMDYVNDSVTDRQLQAHAMAYLRDRHGLEFDRKLNPNAAVPRYYSSKDRGTTTTATVTTGGAGDTYRPAEFVPSPDLGPHLVSNLSEAAAAAAAEELPPSAAPVAVHRGDAGEGGGAAAADRVAEET